MGGVWRVARRDDRSVSGAVGVVWVVGVEGKEQTAGTHGRLSAA